MPPPSPALLDLLTRLCRGETSIEEAIGQISQAAPGDPDRPPGQDQVAAIEGAMVDIGRVDRCGFGEVIYGEGKSSELISRIIKAQLGANQTSLVTRIDSGVAFQVHKSFEFASHNPVARTLRVASQAIGPVQPLSPELASTTVHAAVITAGSTDVTVAEEAIETLAWMGVPVQRFDDLGIAGPQRLQAALPRLRLASAVVAIAGMEGALPAVVAGHLAVPVFAVPTSVGYGANMGGITPLMGMLSSCATNVAVVNIDAGFKGGFMAGLVVRQITDQMRRQKDDQDG